MKETVKKRAEHAVPVSLKIYAGPGTSGRRPSLRTSTALTPWQRDPPRPPLRFPECQGPSPQAPLSSPPRGTRTFLSSFHQDPKLRRGLSLLSSPNFILCKSSVSSYSAYRFFKIVQNRTAVTAQTTFCLPPGNASPSNENDNAHATASTSTFTFSSRTSLQPSRTAGSARQASRGRGL